MWPNRPAIYHILVSISATTVLVIQVSKPRETLIIPSYNQQKQPSRGLLTKRYSEISSNLAEDNPYRSVISINETVFRHVSSPVNLMPILRTLFHNNSYGLLLLNQINALKPFRVFITVTQKEYRNEVTLWKQ